MKVWMTVAIVFMILLMLPVAPVFGGDYYVDAVNGSDESGDGSAAHPWKRLQFAFDSIEGTAENPHTIHLAPGIYGPRQSGDEEIIWLDSYENLLGDERFERRPYVTITGIGNIKEHTSVNDVTVKNINFKK
jgi:hypothetical protein